MTSQCAHFHVMTTLPLSPFFAIFSPARKLKSLREKIYCQPHPSIHFLKASYQWDIYAKNEKCRPVNTVEKSNMYTPTPSILR